MKPTRSGLLALLALVAALTAGAGARQQTFWSAKAAPKIPPKATAQPINPDYLYLACMASEARHDPRSRPAHSQHGRAGNPCVRPHSRPRPRHT